MIYLKRFLITLVVYMVLDTLWLGLTIRTIYKTHLGNIISDKMNYGAACIFYIIFIAGLLYFVLNPAIEKQSLKHALVAGVIFGLVTYSTYDLTNQATLKDWSWVITSIDIIWGMFISGSVSGASYLILNKL